MLERLKGSEENNKLDEWSELQNIPFDQEVVTNSSKDIIAEIADVNNITVYERLNASNDKVAKEEFLANPALIHPNNKYGFLDPDEVKTSLQIIDDVEKKIEQSDFAEPKKRLLRILSDNSRNKHDFLLANIEYNEANTPEEKAKAAEHHRIANEKLYGKPDEATFEALLTEKLAKIDVENLSPEDRKKYDWVLSEIGPIKNSEAKRFKPKQETVERFSELVKEFFGGFLKHIPEDQDEFTGEEMANIANEILSDEFSDEPDTEATPYRAIASLSDSGSASVSHEKRQISFPAKKIYPRDTAIGIILHEIGVHTLRAIPYTDQDISAFSTGFPDNETWDEGIAKCVEQAINGKYSDSGVDHYINIGLATFKGKNFREVYEIQRAINDLSGKSSDKLINGVQRCFRGTGELVNNKDLAYYNGATRVWQYIEEHIDDPELFDNLFLVGKLDITKPEQAVASYEKRMGKL